MTAELVEVEKIKKKYPDYVQEMNLLSQQNKELQKTTDTLTTEIRLIKESAKAAEEAMTATLADLEIDRSTIGRLEKDLATQKTTFNSELEEYKIAAVEKYELGFNHAIDQVHVIAPEVDTSEAYVWKQIVDGQFVLLAPEEETTEKSNEENRLPEGTTSPTITTLYETQPVATTANNVVLTEGNSSQ